jgi:transcriptional regulator with XRE-family HTH domain
MITNERQHRITRAESRRFQEAIEQAERDRDIVDLDPRLYEAMIDGLRSQLADLTAQMRQYEALRNGDVKRRVLRSLLDLPDALIEARIVRGLSQKELGHRLGLAEQQIQRYEATRYAGAAIERLQDVADALGIELKKTIDYAAPSTASPSKRRASVPAKKSRRGLRIAASARRSGGKKVTSKARGASQKQTGKSRSTAKVPTTKASDASTQTRRRKPAGKRKAATGAKAVKKSAASKTQGQAVRSTPSRSVRKKG